jgi:hypothetical protein
MEKKIRLGELASAINTTTKAISHWMQDRGAEPQKQQSGVWREFGWGDVAVFAITRYLIDTGMPTAGAFNYATTVVKKRWPELFDADNRTWSFTADNAAVDFHFGRSTYYEGYDNWGCSALEGEGLERRMTRALDTVADKKFPARVILTVYVGFIIHDAFDALAEMGYRPPQLEGPAVKRGIPNEGVTENESSSIEGAARLKG